MSHVHICLQDDEEALIGANASSDNEECSCRCPLARAVGRGGVWDIVGIAVLTTEYGHQLYVGTGGVDR